MLSPRGLVKVSLRRYAPRPTRGQLPTTVYTLSYRIRLQPRLKADRVATYINSRAAGLDNQEDNPIDVRLVLA